MNAAAPALALARQAGQEEPDSILEIVWRQRAVLGVTTGICVVAALLYLLIATRYYSGYAKLFVQQSGPQIMGEPARNVQDRDAFHFTQREVMTSTPVIAMVLGTPGVRELKTFADQENTFTYFKDHLTIEVGKKDDLIAVQFDTPYKDDAQKIVAALVDSFIEYQSRQRHTNSTGVLKILQQEREKRVAELGKKQDELQAFRAQHGMVAGSDDKTNVVLQRLEKLSEALMAAQMETIAAKTAFDDVSRSVLADPERLEAFESYRADAGYSAPTAVDDAQLRAEMLQWQAYKQTLSGRYMSRHPLVQNAQKKIDELNLFYAAAVHRRWESAKTKEGVLQVEFDQQQKLAVNHNASALADTRLAREVETLTQASEELDKRVREVSVTQGGAAPNISVVEPPSISKSPTRPYTGRTLILALLGGLVVGCGLACVRDWYDYRLRSPDEIKASLGITVLGLIPHVSDETSPIARGQKIHIDPSSDTAEAYRSLRTAIHFGTKEHPARTILITSPERGDGKTTLASNLAISMAQAGRRVLLIDADMRAPMQDLIFSLNGRLGLANVLAGKEAADSAIRRTGIENLDLLPAGSASRNPSELLNSQGFMDLLETQAEKYDDIVIDSPPLLAVTDARIIAASADATVLVLRAGKSNRKLSELSIDGLVSVGARLLGAVVNDVQRRNYAYDGSYGKYAYGSDIRSDRGALDLDPVAGNGHDGAGMGGAGANEVGRSHDEYSGNGSESASRRVDV
ncbi:MAG: polysaccharide biosynthesis tyrosine autokinase [Tepidisphaeraceae bacterium]